MDKREQIIEALEMSYRFSNVDENNTLVPQEIVLDIIALLKAQEPRVMTLEPRVMTLEELVAAQKMKMPVWRETKRAHKDMYNGWMLAYNIQLGQCITGTRQDMTAPNGRVVRYKLDDYGKTWRCWTARPDEETRRAEPWQQSLT